MKRLSRNTRSVIAVALGSVLILLGLAGLVLPLAPGIVFLLAGIVLLSLRFVWARRIRHSTFGFLGRHTEHRAPRVHETLQGVERHIKRFGLADTSELDEAAIAEHARSRRRRAAGLPEEPAER